jgi:hypothetical protein
VFPAVSGASFCCHALNIERIIESAVTYIARVKLLSRQLAAVAGSMNSGGAQSDLP